jgi:hypothetical protein
MRSTSKSKAQQLKSTTATQEQLQAKRERAKLHDANNEA